MFRFFAWLVIFGWIAWLFKKYIASQSAPTNPTRGPQTREASPRQAVRLERDPWCGTYVSPEISFPLEQGENGAALIHFCSADCRARYQRLDRLAADQLIAARSAQSAHAIRSTQHGSEGEKL